MILMNAKNVSSPVGAFVAAVGTLLNATADYAATKLVQEVRDRGRRASTDGLTQCTPDLSPADCRSCLGSIISSRTQFLNATQGGRISGMRCILSSPETRRCGDSTR